MAKIIELDAKLANQIAAGEVVERPASVVKELVENAIDAGSRQIEILVEEGGLRKIEIIDDGEGIASDDVENAFKRHATSKIHSRDDLFRIRTLGFRGEALPSIASVSELTIETSTGSDVGTLLKIKGGDITENKPHSLRKGTKITVENLFYNTPARLKYVKTVQTELANIGDIVNRLAMSHPDIAFRLVHDGNKMLATIGNGDLKQTLAGIYGIANAKKMLPIQQEDLDFKLSGYISLPELTRANRNYMSVIINGRYIKNFILNRAIVEGYGSKLMVGRFPLVVIEITMDPLLVDVNVHPTKQEVRISKEKELQELVVSGIRQTLSSQQLIPKVDPQISFKKKSEVPPVKEKVEQLNLSADEKSQPNPSTPSPPKYGNMKSQGLAYDKTEGKFYLTNEKSEPVNKENSLFNESQPGFKTLDNETVEPKDFDDPFKEKFPTENVAEATEDYRITNSGPILEAISLQDGDFESERTSDVKEEAEIVSSLEVDEDLPVQTKRFPSLDYVGQMHGTYLFAQNEEGLYILDQHAAQERIKYEYFREKIGEVGDSLQELLVPLVFDFPANESLKIKENEQLLQEVGIHLEPFGQNSFLVRSHPTWYPKGEEEAIIRDMIDTVLTSGKVSVAKFREATAIMMSCKGSIKANHYLNDSQARQLLMDLEKCENPFNCPHGRPVLVHFTNKDMEKMFKRIQDPH